MNRLIRKFLYIGDVSQWLLKEESIKQIATFDLLRQFRLVLVKHYDIILLDLLHLLFENCGKTFILKLIDTSLYRNNYYLRRHIGHWDSIYKRVFLPHFICSPRSMKDLSYWKAHDIMNLIFASASQVCIILSTISLN